MAFLCLFELYRDTLTLRWPVGLGLALGFGTWFCYTTLASVAIVLVWWLWNDRRMLTRRAFAVFLACFALGFSPWLLVNASRASPGSSSWQVCATTIFGACPRRADDS